MDARSKEERERERLCRLRVVQPTFFRYICVIELKLHFLAVLGYQEETKCCESEQLKIKSAVDTEWGGCLFALMSFFPLGTSSSSPCYSWVTYFPSGGGERADGIG